jgi:hypothetical protein
VHDHSHTGANATASKTKGATGVDFTTEQEAQIRARLGLAEDAELTADTVAGAFAEESPILAATALPGQILIDRGEWDKLQRRVTDLTQVQQVQAATRRDETLEAAVRDGKFAPDRVPTYRQLWDANPTATAAAIDAMQGGIVPVGPKGSPGGDEHGSLDREYNALFGR